MKLSEWAELHMDNYEVRRGDLKSSVRVLAESIAQGGHNMSLEIMLAKTREMEKRLIEAIEAEHAIIHYKIVVEKAKELDR